jgi:hypothetical protein
MQRIHHLLVASLSLVCLAAACDLPAAPVGKDDGDGNGSKGDDGGGDVDDGDVDGGEDDSGDEGNSGPVDGDGGTDDGGVDDGAGDGDDADNGPPTCENPCAGTEGQLGFYMHDKCEPGFGSFGTMSGMSCQDALDHCLIMELVNPGYAYHCEWDGREIHRTQGIGNLCDPYHGPASCNTPSPCVPVDPTCGGLEGEGEDWEFLVFYDCDAGVFDGPSPAQQEVLRTCEDVVARCAQHLADHPGESHACLFGLNWLMYSEAVAGACSGMNAC